MNSEPLYSDTLVEIDKESILVRNYYFPFGDKRISMHEIDVISVDKPSLFSGKYRYVGTGDFRVWFPPDNRTKRDRVFTIKLKKKWWRVGFTAEDSTAVLQLLKHGCPLVDNTRVAD